MDEERLESDWPKRPVGAIDTARYILRHSTVTALEDVMSDHLAGVGAVLVSNNPGSSVKPSSVSSHVFGYRCRGAQSRRIDMSSRSQGTVGRPGMSLFLAADEASKWECEGAHEMLGFFFGVQFLADLATEAFGVDGHGVQFHDGTFGWDEYSARLGRCVEQQLRADEPTSSIELDSWAQILGLHVLRRYSSLAGKVVKIATSGLSRKQLQIAIEFIQSNLSSALRLSDVAGSICMSQHTFARAFKNTTGVTPHQYLTNLRIERAQQLLATGTLPLSFVASAVGFFDQSHLTMHFRRALGTTPGRFRSQHRD